MVSRDLGARSGSVHCVLVCTSVVQQPSHVASSMSVFWFLACIVRLISSLVGCVFVSLVAALQCDRLKLLPIFVLIVDLNFKTKTKNVTRNSPDIMP